MISRARFRLHAMPDASTCGAKKALFTGKNFGKQATFARPAHPLRYAGQRGLALPVALVVIGIVLVLAVAITRIARQDLGTAASAGDRAFAAEATDAALKATMAEVQALSGVPEMIDPDGATLPWWNKTSAPIAASFWTGCAAAPAGARCKQETVTRSGRTYIVQRTVQPTGAPDENTGTAGAYGFYYRVSVLVTLDNGARAEVEGYVRKVQLSRT